MKIKKGQQVHLRIATASGERKFNPPLTHRHWVTITIGSDESLTGATVPLLTIELPLDEYGRLIAQRDALGWVDEVGR